MVGCFFPFHCFFFCPLRPNVCLEPFRRGARYRSEGSRICPKEDDGAHPLLAGACPVHVASLRHLSVSSPALEVHGDSFAPRQVNGGFAQPKGRTSSDAQDSRHPQERLVGDSASTVVELPYLDVCPLSAENGAAQGTLPLWAARGSPSLEADALQEVPCLQVSQEPDRRLMAEGQGSLPCSHSPEAVSRGRSGCPRLL